MLCTSSFAQTVDRIESANLTPGKKARLVIHGKKLTGPIALWTSFGTFPASTVDSKTQDLLVQCDAPIPDSVTPGIYETRLLAKAGISDAGFVMIDDLPSVIVPSSSDTAKPFGLPAACCVKGHVDRVKAKSFRFSLAKGQLVNFEVYARRLNSLMDPVLTLRDHKGAEVGFADDTTGLSGDAQLSFEASHDGEYVLELRDVKYDGGGGHFFHLRVGKFPLVQGTYPRRASSGKIRFVAEDRADVLANVQLTDPEARDTQQISLVSSGGSGVASVAVISKSPKLEVEPNEEMSRATDVTNHRFVAGRLQERGDVDWFRITLQHSQHLCVTAHTRELQSPADVLLELYDSTGRKLQHSDDATPMDAQLSAMIRKPGDYFFCVRELTESGGSIWTYDLEVSLGGNVQLTTEVDRILVPSNGTAVIPINVKRHGPKQALEISVLDLPPRLKSSTVIVDPKQQTAFLTLSSAKPSGKYALRRLQVEARLSSGRAVPMFFQPGAKKDLQHRLMRVQSGVLVADGRPSAIAVNSDGEIVRLPVGGRAKVLLKVKRTGDWNGPVNIVSAIPKAELPNGITVDPMTVNAESGQLILNAAKTTKPGRYSVSLNGTIKKDKTVVVQPVPTITVEVY